MPCAQLRRAKKKIAFFAEHPSVRKENVSQSTMTASYSVISHWILILFASLFDAHLSARQTTHTAQRTFRIRGSDHFQICIQSSFRNRPFRSPSCNHSLRSYLHSPFSLCSYLSARTMPNNNHYNYPTMSQTSSRVSDEDEENDSNAENSSNAEDCKNTWGGDAYENSSLATRCHQGAPRTIIIA